MISQLELKTLLTYDPIVGRFFWIESGPGRNTDKPAGSCDGYGYGQINLTLKDGKYKSYKEHRLVWLYVTGEWPPDQIDHIDHDRRNNRFENLRLATNIENHKNKPIQINNTSGFVGVHLDKQKNIYQAYINVEGKKINLGWFKNFEDAVLARKKANVKYGFHANHGASKVKQLKKEQS